MSLVSLLANVGVTVGKVIAKYDVQKTIIQLLLMYRGPNSFMLVFGKSCRFMLVSVAGCIARTEAIFV